jgi:hypothetical protein
VITTTVDSAKLTPEQAETLRAMVGEANLAGLVPREGGLVHPDAGGYRVTVDYGDGSSQSVVVPELGMPDPVRSLISWIQSVPSREETVT